jgi:biotin carboxylase
MAGTLMLLGASHFYVPVIWELQKLGFQALVTDRNPEAEGFRYADLSETVDISDREGTLKVARAHKIQGIMAVNDFGVRTASYVAEQLGLVGIHRECAAASCDKGKQRQKWYQAGLPQPEFGMAVDFHSATEVANRIGFPLVIKPTDSGGASRGVSVVRDLSQLEWAFHFAQPFSKTGEVILEGYIEGIESTVECLIFQGQVEILAVSDKVKPVDTRYRVAVGLYYPAFFPSEVMAQIRQIVPKAIHALGLETGAAHAELMMRPDGRIWIVEMAARPGGGHIFHTVVPQVSGINMVQELAKILMGRDPSIKRQAARGAAYKFFIPPKGRIREIRGAEVAASLEGVLALGIQVKPGEVIGELAGQHNRAGYVVTAGETRDEAVARAAAVERTIIFDVE